jgi:hypothetical protein
MEIKKESNELISFFVKNNCGLPLTQTNKTDMILKNLYYDIKNGVSYVNIIKTKIGNSFYKLNVKHITNVREIPKPFTFPANSFPPEVRKHINEYSVSSLTYDFNMFNRNINIIFITENDNIETLIDTYNNYVDYMLVWLYIADIYSSKKCVKQLKIFIYHTSLLKILPDTNIDILNQNNVNTGFSRTCPSDSEIVIFRKEEWFKVFIHETFHNFGLDFSSMNVTPYNQMILKLFSVNSEVNLYEAYTEFWARMINALFCSFIIMKNKNDIDEFYTNAEFFINVERMFAFFQTVKVLDFMSLSYDNLYNKTSLSENLRNTLYKEDTNVLAYYVLTLILLNNYQEFLSWCNTNNITILNFKKTIINLEKFCKFIEKKYKTKNMLDGIECAETLFYRVKNSKRKKKVLTYLLKNLRMTICELS